MPNVYVTAHMAGPSIPEDVINFFTDNLDLYMSELPLNGMVNRHSSY